ncbi:MAG: exosortase/archaeosortase family protein [Vicinamibacterales bacterium]
MSAPVMVVEAERTVETRSEVLWLGVVSVLFVGVYGPTLVWLWGRWTMSVWHNAHGLLIPPVAAYFIHDELRRHAGVARAGSAWGFACLVPALLIHAVDLSLDTRLLSAASIVIALPGLALLLIGPALTRTIWFPLAFLAFMLPIPLGVVERLIMALRHVAADAAATLVPWLGVPVYAEGTTLHLAHASLQVADACSGFSTLYAAMAVACLTAFATRSTTRRMLVLALAAPIAVSANVLRVSLLVLLVHWQGTDVLATSLHSISGLLTFGLALPVIFWLGSEPPDAAAEPRP